MLGSETSTDILPNWQDIIRNLVGEICFFGMRTKKPETNPFQDASGRKVTYYRGLESTLKSTSNYTLPTKYVIPKFKEKLTIV